METTRLNQTQIHLLKMFELQNSEDSLNELKDVLYRHYDILNNIQFPHVDVISLHDFVELLHT